MIIIKALLLFLLYDGTFCQEPASQACQNITEALYANQDCQKVYAAIARASNNATNLTLSDLQGFCARDCRNLVVQQAMECNDDGSNSSTFVSTRLELICSVNSDGKSCLELPQLLRTDLFNECITLNGTCPEGCDTTLQEFVDPLGCCYHLLFPFLVSPQFSAQANDTLQACSVNVPLEQPPCQVLGESNGDNGGDDDGDNDDDDDGDDDGSDDGGNGGGAINLKAFDLGVVLCVATIVSSF